MKKRNIKLVNLNNLKQSPIFEAQESGITCLSININWTLLATASDKGTLIGVFHVTTGKLITELRRGSKNAEINWHSFCCFEENYYSETIEGEPKNQKFNYHDEDSIISLGVFSYKSSIGF